MQKPGQVVFISGGDSFSSNEAFYEYLRAQEYEPHPEPRQRWRDWLQSELEPAGYEWLYLEMPNKQNADYEAWKIWFEKIVPFIEVENPTHVVGYSLGACFLLRYLTENDAPFTIDHLHLVALALEDEGVDGDLGSFAVQQPLLTSLAGKAADIHLYHSTEDPICPYSHSEQVASAVPTATLHTYTDRNHFLQSEFPELLTAIKK
jgi:predicted alpha/beta hydrolase family esterase